MSIDRFIAAAKAHAKYTENGDAAGANKADDELVRAREEMRNIGDQGVSALAGVLKDGNPGVRLWAAYYLLPSAPDIAAKVLADLSAEPGLVAFSADITLREWRAGNLKVE